MSKVLFGAPVRVKSTVLKEFLYGLENVEKGENEVAFYFVDDNFDERSSELLREFASRNNTIIKKGSELFQTDYHYDGHNWNPETLQKVTVYKNTIIQYCIDEGFDYLFLIDSDIVLDKRSLLQLLSDNVDIVSNVFWIPDIYLQESNFCKPRSFEESHKIRMGTYEKLKTPGIYQVDGLGACTLISRKALEAGVSFKEIPNLKIFGEDRPFCIRAGALGFTLYMDTHYPAYHCSKEIYLDRVDEFKRDGWKFDMCCRYEDEQKKIKPFPKTREFIVRAAAKVVRDLSD